MAVKQKDIEKEIEKLASFVDRQISSTQQLRIRLAPYLDKSGENISKVIDACKPVIKRRTRDMQILILKAQLRIMDRKIENKNRNRSGEDQKEGIKKGGR